MKCAVHNCTNKFKSKQKHSEQLSFFSFPKQPDLLRKWVTFSRKKGSKEKLDSYLKNVMCNEHFKEEDIQGGLQFQMGLCSKRTLRPGAVPCINNNDISAAERERRERRRNKKLVAELLEEVAAREAAEASGEIVVAPAFVRNTGIVSVPDFVSATGNAFIPFTPTPSESDPLAEELEQSTSKCPSRAESPVDPCSTESPINSIRAATPNDHKICRTCYRSFLIDENAKDLSEDENAVMLYHIEVITGIWVSIEFHLRLLRLKVLRCLLHPPIQCQEGISQFMCSRCVDNLRTAIEFREVCIRTEVQFTTVDDLSLPTIIKESDTELCNIEEMSEAQQGLNDSDLKAQFISVFPARGKNGETTVVESLGRTISQQQEQQKPQAKITVPVDPNSLALGAQIYEDLLNEYRGKEKPARPRPKKIRITKTRTIRQRKRQSREPKPTRPKRTREERNRIRREQIRAMPLNHVCDQCGASFRVRCNLTIHMLRHTRTKNYQCTECSKEFYDAYSRNIHIRVRHKGELPFACNYCTKAFSSSNTRYLHEKNIHGASPRIHRNVNKLNKKIDMRQREEQQAEQKRKQNIRHFCNYCDKSYATKYALKWHINVHIGATPFKCKLCDMRFTDPQLKKKHEMQHDKRPYECDICLKGFYVRSKLKEHERIHTGERPYRCEICNAFFRYKFNLYSHQFSKMHKENLQKLQMIEIIEDSN